MLAPQVVRSISSTKGLHVNEFTVKTLNGAATVLQVSPTGLIIEKSTRGIAPQELPTDKLIVIPQPGTKNVAPCPPDMTGRDTTNGSVHGGTPPTPVAPLRVAVSVVAGIQLPSMIEALFPHVNANEEVTESNPVADPVTV
jgi:hypothetical protein